MARGSTLTEFELEDEAAICRWLGEDATAPMCPRCGTVLQAATPIAGGHSVTIVWEIRCAACNRYMLAGRALQPLLAIRRQKGVTEADRSSARQLALEFAGTPGSPSERVLTLVQTSWPEWSRGQQRDIAQALVFLLSSGTGAPDLANVCEGAVASAIEARRH
jgi:phage FluMu protein Com